MKDFLLFVDTETSGLPANWKKPYADTDSWPYIAQLAWLIYTRDGQLVKTENHYLRVPAGAMSPVSLRIHGLTPEFLDQHGQADRPVLQRLHDDLLHYRPLVVGHFMELDYHMMGVGFYRAGLPNLLRELPTFCTMKITGTFMRHARQRYLPLGELYERLFNRPLEHQHDAEVDARAAADCFFALWESGDINEAVLEQEPRLHEPGTPVLPSRWRWGLVVLGVVFFLFLYWLYG